MIIPHTRGALVVCNHIALRSGIIPAYAGSTLSEYCRRRSRRDHPRIRGEHPVRRVIRDRRAGSSPHTRGAPLRSGFDPHGRGIIPAYAGSTRRRHHCRCPSRDHPRIRGEHDPASGLVECTNRPGSSPHTRGARDVDSSHEVGVGIIPAYAGSTLTTSSFSLCVWDHPRIRGEHISLVRIPVRSRGSSPHTRGARVAGGLRRIRAGIIPAYAGSTPSSSAPCPASQDHPRIRGEHLHECYNSDGEAGSSPHTRGARAGRRSGRNRLGIIPAYAGSTRAGRKRSVACRDHPRIRGEHAMLIPRMKSV